MAAQKVAPYSIHSTVYNLRGLWIHIGAFLPNLSLFFLKLYNALLFVYLDTANFVGVPSRQSISPRLAHPYPSPIHPLVFELYNTFVDVTSRHSPAPLRPFFSIVQYCYGLFNLYNTNAQYKCRFDISVLHHPSLRNAL